MIGRNGDGERVSGKHVLLTRFTDDNDDLLPNSAKLKSK